ERSFREIELLSAAERQQLVEWNDTGRPRPAAQSLHQAFSAQAQRTPEAVALVVGQERWTYQRLEEESNRLASGLVSLGLRPEETVAVCLHRTAQLPLALLSVLKAGGAYVPVDPAYPQERRRFMLEDSGSRLAITEGDLLDDLLDAGEDGAAGQRTLVRLDQPLDRSLDRQWPASEGASAAWEPVAGQQVAEQLAYVIYTSGSTGRPKGVAIEHRSALALLEWSREHYGAEDLSAVMAATSVCFDLSIFELFVPLTRGGTVVLAKDALALREVSEGLDSGVRLVNTVPSALAELVRGEGLPASVRTVNLAGEALSRELVDSIYRSSQVQRVFNLYGPSEDTTYSTWNLVPRDSQEAPTIGGPLGGTVAYVADRFGRQVPTGVAGELLLGGAGLARGYLGRPALTAEKWIPDGLSEGEGLREGGRLYRTGDLVRRRPDGELEFLGRIDHQVKVRGFRIELGEVEAVAASQEGVGEVVVTARATESAGLQLVAYATPAEGVEDPQDLAETIRNAVSERLPAYMVPSHVVMLEQMPLTPNGKVDRRRLPAPDGSVAAADQYLAPRTEVERLLVKLWERMLDVSPISIRANFFALGGHSLLGVRLLNNIEQTTGKRLPVAALFKNPTIEALAALISGESEEGLYASLVPIRPEGEGKPMYWVHPVSGTVFFYRNLVEHLDDQRPHFGIQSQGLDGGIAPFNRIEDMAAHYVSEIIEHQPEGPYHVGGWSFGGTLAYEVASQLRRLGKEVAPVVLLDSKVPSAFDRLGARDEENLLDAFALNFGLQVDIELPEEEFSQLSLNDRLAYILERAQDSGQFPPEVKVKQLRRFFEIFKINFQALPAYEPGPYDGDLILLKASEALPPPEESSDDGPWERLVRGIQARVAILRARYWDRWVPNDLGWKKASGTRVRVERVPGHHFDMLGPNHIAELGKILTSVLSEFDDVQPKRSDLK
ncbi:MAG: amino acid adenylation domain-containing protein, partial [Acidobacteriota bacterium]|nr:amino acid adenylation domain-containing protein [Acidobacteriota bacterium]